MNEVTQIHLGRQAYTIAADAHTALRTYLKAIQAAAGKEVADEVELRMSELLGEHGVNGEKVVLLTDVEYLRSQLGEPADFSDDAEAAERPAPPNGASKRLFRDTQNGMVAGVAAGLGAFFGIDVLLVRILFVLATLAWGWGILLYIALWILVPEAKTPSDRLQMQGKAVTVESLKKAIDNADVEGAAERFSRKVSPVINGIFSVVLKIAGFFVILGALAVLFALIVGTTYTFMHHGQIIAENYFPVGTTEHLALYIALGCIALGTVFMVLLGLAMVRRRWPTAPWATGVLLGLLFVGLTTGTTLATDVVPAVRDRIQKAHRTTTRTVGPFTSLVSTGDLMPDVIPGTNYQVVMTYVGNPDLSGVKTTVKDGVLTIDSSGFKARTDCSILCLYRDYDLKITVDAPNAMNLRAPDVRLPDPLTLNPKLP